MGWPVNLSQLRFTCHTDPGCRKKQSGIVNLIGRPPDSTLDQVHQDAARIIIKGQINYKFKPKQKQHHRGEFDVEAVRYSHGGRHVSTQYSPNS